MLCYNFTTPSVQNLCVKQIKGRQCLSRNTTAFFSCRSQRTSEVNAGGCDGRFKFRPNLCGIGAACLLCTSCAQAISVESGLIDGHLRQCVPKSSCVSTSSFNSPSQYLPPWLYGSQTKQQAIEQLSTLINDVGGEINLIKDNYLSVSVPYKFGGQIDEDIDEFLFKDDGIVVFRSQSMTSLPDPPGCIKKGCINGPRNRGRMEEIRDKLQWQQLETDEDKIWVPLLLH